MSIPKPILIYIFDPLCGWCYGFSPVIGQLHAAFSDRFHFEVWSGGMVTGDRVGPLGDMKDYILSAIPRLEATTGVKVSEAFRERLIEGSTTSDSEPPSRAFHILKKANRERSVQWGSEIQKLLYVEGKDLNLPESYLSLAEEAGIGADAFLQQWQAPEIADVTRAEFAQVAKIGVQGFPSLLLHHNNQLFQVAHGYRPFESISQVLTQSEILN